MQNSSLNARTFNDFIKNTKTDNAANSNINTALQPKALPQQKADSVELSKTTPSKNSKEKLNKELESAKKQNGII